MTKPEISNRFDLDDIRKIRDYNSERYASMTPQEIVADTKAGAAELMTTIANRSSKNKVMIISDENPTPVAIPAVS